MTITNRLESALVTVEAIQSVRQQFAHACRTGDRAAVSDAHARLTNLYAQLDTLALANALVERMRLEVQRGTKPQAV